MAKGFVYFAGVMDWATRKILSWRLSNTLTADFCVEALEEAIARYGAPDWNASASRPSAIFHCPNTVGSKTTTGQCSIASPTF